MVAGMSAPRGAPQSSQVLFFIAFAALAISAIRTSIASPLGTGQDFNYHLMSASLAARGWSGDPTVTSLYHTINPTDSNTLLYTLLFPLEKLFAPVDAFKLGLGLLYFVGFPAACAAALSILRRPLWPALLAFPLCYVKSLVSGGYLPFVTAAPFFVLSIALFHRVLSDASERGAPEIYRAPARTWTWAAMLACTLVFLGHGHMHAWLMVVLAFITLWAMGQAFIRELAFSPGRALLACLKVGLRALALVGPSLVLFAFWYARTHMGAHTAKSAPWLPSHDTGQAKLTTILPLLTQLRGEEEYTWIAALAGVSLLAFLLAGRRDERLPSAEIAFFLTVGSYFLLPWTVTQQAIGSRQLDIALWLLPLVVYPRVVARAPVRHAIVAAAMTWFAFARTNVFTKQLHVFQSEMAGLYDMARPCPVVPAEMAYVTYGTDSEVWFAQTFHQSHETLAAMCKIDTPVYDAQIYPHNLLPLRYKGALPAPVTILVSPNGWYKHPRLWENFELVLVHNWTGSPEQIEEARTYADRIRISGKWQLWRRRYRRDWPELN
jgi:hypothetical protein